MGVPVEPAAVVLDVEHHFIVHVGQCDADPAGVRVPTGVGQRLLGDPDQADPHGRVERNRGSGHYGLRGEIGLLAESFGQPPQRCGQARVVDLVLPQCPHHSTAFCQAVPCGPEGMLDVTSAGI